MIGVEKAELGGIAIINTISNISKNSNGSVLKMQVEFIHWFYSKLTQKNQFCKKNLLPILTGALQLYLVSSVVQACSCTFYTCSAMSSNLFLYF